MKINRQLLKKITLIFVIFALFELTTPSNLKEKKSAQIEDKNTQPDSSKKSDVKEDEKYNVKTAIYVLKRGMKQIKQLKNDRGEVYDQCVDTCVTPSANHAMKNLWTYLQTVDFQGKEELKKEPFNKFCVEAMTDEKLTVNKVKVECDDICKSVSVKSFDDNMQKDLRAIFAPYFASIDFSGAKKNLITAYIGTYRDTPLGRALPRKLNRY